MLGQNPFYWELLRKYVLIMGTVLNDIDIQRTDENGNPQQTIRVPISYAGRDKVLARLEADPNIDRPSAVTLPRIAFQLTGMQYDAERKMRGIERWAVLENRETGLYREQLAPVPYRLKFTAWVFAKYQLDGNQIIEQILPFFTPTFRPTAILIPEIQPYVDVPITLDGDVVPEDVFTGDFSTRRAIIWTLNFVMNVEFYGPVRRHPIIKFANVNFYVPKQDDLRLAPGNTDVVPIDRVTVRPGLTANGTPTTNAAATVPFSEINFTDDWGYVIEVAGDLLSNDVGPTSNESGEII